jgi:glyoxylate/hydroxypyruvate reductase A
VTAGAFHVLLSGRFEARERGDWLRALRDAGPEFSWWSDDEGEIARETIDAAVVANPAPAALQGMPQLRLVQSLWAGVDRLLADATLPPDVPLARMVEPMLSAAMAETALWATLSLQRGFFDYVAQQRAGVWQQLEQRRAEDMRVLVLGLGQMGSAVASRLAAQGLRVSGWRLTLGGPSTPSDIAVHAGAEGLTAALPTADVVLNLLPLTAATSGLLDARFFASMRSGASLVNLARGAHVVDDDLLAALDAGHLRHAVLDVFQVEPLPAEHRYWQHPHVTLLPHVAALTDIRSAAQVVAANLRAARDGTALAHQVDRARGY